MTPTHQQRSPAKDYVVRELQVGALFFTCLLGAWKVASAISSTKLDRSVYEFNRMRDSLIHVGELRAQSDHDRAVDRKLNTILCRLSPNDTDCDKGK